MNAERRMLQGTFHTTAHGRVSYEIYYATPDIMKPIEAMLIARFGCSRWARPTVGFDAVVTQCQCNGLTVNIGWDNWSGFYLFADTEAGDALVREIGTYLDTHIGSEDFEQYIHFW